MWPSKVEPYLKDECMVWVTIRGDIRMWQGLSTDSQCIDQKLHHLLYYIIKKISI